MKLKQLSFSFFLTIAIGVFSFAMLNLPAKDYFKITRRENKNIVNQLDTVPAKKSEFPLHPTKKLIDLKDPASVEKSEEYDPATGQYILTEKIGEEYYSAPTSMTFDQYLDYKSKQQEQQYFDHLSGSSKGFNKKYDTKNPLAKYIPSRSLIDRLFGGTEPVITPQGNIDLTFGYDYTKVDNPIYPIRQQRVGGFNFDMNIQVNVTGRIGEKLNLSTQFNNRATFDFENQMKLDYNSQKFNEDEIIRSIEAGNVSLPLKSTLIKGSSALFGVKAELQFGYLRLIALASQQKSKRKSIELKSGKELQTFAIKTDEYDENRHFFLSHYNRNSFENTLKNLPQVNTLFRLNKIEVWMTNSPNQREDKSRDIVALADIGEHDVITSPFPPPGGPRNPDIYGKELPANNANDLYDAIVSDPTVKTINKAVSVLTGPKFKFQQIRDFEKVRARLLNESEYTVNKELGTISMNINVKPSDVLGVAYEYTYNGKTIRVGQLSTENPTNPDTTGVLFVKMLKSTTPRVDLPLWDLMMKNVYSIGAYNVDQQDFKLDIFYEDPGQGEKRFLPATNLKGEPLISVFNLDKLNKQNDPTPDGIFDYVPGITINPRTGRMMFPVLEPFGKFLTGKIDNPNLAKKYAYQQLYDSTVTVAREYAEFNRFTIKGSFKSSITSDISLGVFNLPKGSVIVTAGGVTLLPDVDYSVDYNTGRVKILNDAYLLSGVPINISFEDNSLFSFQTRTMLGLRAEYQFAKNFTVGATYLNLFERPFTQKVNVGEDPIDNKIYGLDLNFSKDLPWLTKAIDKLPMIQTKEVSTVNFGAEGAYLKPGHASAIDESDGGGGNVYIDDFEGATSGLDIKTPATNWVLASIPQYAGSNAGELFPESKLVDNLLTGVNRAKLSWYRIDETLRGNSANTDDPYVIGIPQKEIFPNRQIPSGYNPNIQTFDLHFEPTQRGPYNFDLPNGSAYSAGLNENGTLKSPEKRWGGIMRQLQNNTDFEAANYEYVEFWVLNPFINNQNNSGDLYINLGNVSEDILRDSRLFSENALPNPSNPALKVDSTVWGRVPRTLIPGNNNSFDANPAVRAVQDIGLDGLDDAAERVKFDNIYQQLKGFLNPQALQAFENDPSNDDFLSFQDPSYTNANTIFDKYSRYNGTQGNNQPAQNNLINSSTQNPDTEDIIPDNTLNEAESYFEYKIPIHPDANGQLEDNKYITESIDGPDGRKWYRFVIPIQEFDRKVGGIQDFRSIRFMRMYLNGFQQDVVMRFATLDLIRSQWRKYKRPFKGFGELPDNNQTKFDISKVSIEENSKKYPFNYVTPPGIVRENTLSNAQDILQDEQALAMKFCNLKPKDSRAVYKLSTIDLRVFNKMKMFAHLESSEDIKAGSVSLFLRLGSDFESNYYEYEIPLTQSIDNTLNPKSAEYAAEVWKAANNMDILLELFKQVKIQRNNSGVSLGTVYSITDPNFPENRVKVVGNPNLGVVKGFMIGLTNNDVLPHCGEVWVNELRVNGFDEKGGYAGLARMEVKLADIGRVNFAGNYTSIGWGSLEQRLAERQRESVLQYDGAFELQLGKFLPAGTGLKIPFLAQVSNTTRTPEYDPYDLDIPLQEKLDAITDPNKRNEARTRAQDYTNIKGFNFTNVRKERSNAKAKPKPWDVENLSLSYAYSQTDKHDPVIELDQIKNYSGSLDYNYSRQVKYIEPFRKLLNNTKILRFIADFNFNPVPNGFIFRTTMDRTFQSTKYRFTGSDLDPNIISTYYDKRWSWDRNYNINWDLAKSLKITYNATNSAVIDEYPENSLYTDQQKKDYINKNLRNGGRTKTYHHDITANYTVPTKSIAIIDWTTIRAQFSTGYSWNAASLNTDSLGNIIQNNQQRQLNADFDFESLYGKWKYLKKIDKKQGSPTKTLDRNGVKKEVGPPEEAKGLRGAKSDKDLKDLNDKKDGKDTNNGKDVKDNPDAAGKDAKAKEKKKKSDEPSIFERILIRPLLTVRKAKLTYTETYANIVPGFLPKTSHFGLNSSYTAPGLPFILGERPSDTWLDNAAANGWITKSIYINQPVNRNYTREISGQVKLEPFTDFKVDIDVKQNYSLSRVEDFKKPTVDSGFQHLSVREIGSYSITYFTLNTMFTNDINGLFSTFENNRQIISQRLGQGTHPIDYKYGQYTAGFGRYQQEVLVPAFLAAYSKSDPAKTTLTKDLFSSLPRPNWKLAYNGLAKLPVLKDIFSSINITHGYTSVLTISNFNSNAYYPTLQPVTLNYFARYEIPAIVISEQLNPLIGIDVRLKNEMSMRFDVKKTRNLQMSFIDNTLYETKTLEYVFAYGFRIKNIDIPWLVKKAPAKKKKVDDKKLAPPPSAKKPNTGRDLNIKMDFSYRDDVTSNHILDQGITIPTRGSTTIRITPNADYQLNKRLNLRLFWEYSMITPKTTESFPTTNMAAGVTVRFSLN